MWSSTDAVRSSCRRIVSLRIGFNTSRTYLGAPRVARLFLRNGERDPPARVAVVGEPGDHVEHRPLDRRDGRRLQRAVRDLMSEHAGVIRTEQSLREGLMKLAILEERATHVGAHPDIAGFDDLAHAFDLLGSLLAARATLESAIERRETRGCHNRADYPDTDPTLRGNMIWSRHGGVRFEPLPDAPDSFRAPAEESASDSVAGRLIE